MSRAMLGVCLDYVRVCRGMMGCVGVWWAFIGVIFGLC